MEKNILFQFINNIAHHQAVWWKDRDSIFLGCNNTCARCLGLKSADEVIGKSDFDFYDNPEDAKFVRQIDQEIIRTGVPQLNFEEYLNMPSLGNRWLSTSKIPWRDDDNNIVGTIGWFYDITEFKEMQSKVDENDKALLRYSTELKEANRNLELVNMDLEKFTYAASHDLKNPIITMQSFASLLRSKEADNLSKESLGFVDIILKSSNRMLTLIDDILSYAKTGPAELVPKDVNLQQIVSDKITDLKSIIDEKSAKMHLDLPKTEVKAYPELIGLVFYNLISNGIKFNDLTTPTIRCSYTEKEDFWIFSVEDNGPGIADEYAEQIFEPFNRLVGTEIEGTGLGLSICKRVVTLHKGEIWIEKSMEGQTIFQFSISKNLDD